jgi:SIS domain
MDFPLPAWRDPLSGGVGSNISCWSVAGIRASPARLPLWPSIGTPASRPGGSTPSASLVTESATKQATRLSSPSPSGKTGRTIEAARQARAFGHLVAALTGTPDSPFAQAADVVLSAEISTFGFSPGTSTYIAMLVTLLTLATEPLAVGLSEELTVLASIPLSRIRLDLMRLNGRRSSTSPTMRRHGSTTTPSITSRLASRRELARAARGERSS